MKNRYAVLLAMVAILCLCGSAFATDYYVATNGDDSWPGTLAQPWRTLEHAGLTVTAGDTVYVRGGTYANDRFYPEQSGAQGSPITLAAYPDEVPVVTGRPKGAFRYACIDIGRRGNQYIVIDGIHFQDTTTSDNVIIIHDGSHNIVRNCHFTNNAKTMININFSHYNTVEDCHFDTTGDPSGEGMGDHIYLLGADYNLIQDNYFTKAGHSSVDLIDYSSGAQLCEYNIVRNNTIEQHWGSGIGLIRGTSHTLVENNRVYYVGEGVTTYVKSGIMVCGDDNIVRGNIIAWTSAGPVADNALTFEGYIFGTFSQNSRYNCVYNNVIYKAGKEAVMVTQRDDCVVTENQFLNNILYYCRVAGPYEEWWPDGNYYFIFETYHANPDNKWPSFPNFNYYHHNVMLHADETGDLPGEDPFMYYDQDAWGHSLAWVQSQYPTYFHNNIEQNPMFVNAEAGDFHLQSGSPAINAGDFLTRTVSSGTGTTTVPVQEASYFCDGFGIAEGDMVKVGANRPVSITNVDYDTNTLTVASPISFSADDPVSLPYEGSASDMGAFEYGGTPPPPVAEFSGNPTSGPPPLTVYFTDLSSGSPTSWSWDFGDTGSSGAQHPSHEYTAENLYTVSLTAYNAQGQDTETKVDYIDVSTGPVQSCHVGAIDLVGKEKTTGAPSGRGYYAEATITVHDQDCAVLAGVTVDITWSGCVSGTDSGVSDDTGQVMFTSAVNPAGGTFTCCVDNLTKDGYPYNSGANHETCDSIVNP